MLWAGPSSDGSSLLGVVTQGSLTEAGGRTPKTAHAHGWRLGLPGGQSWAAVLSSRGLHACPGEQLVFLTKWWPGTRGNGARGQYFKRQEMNVTSLLKTVPEH